MLVGRNFVSGICKFKKNKNLKPIFFLLKKLDFSSPVFSKRSVRVRGVGEEHLPDCSAARVLCSLKMISTGCLLEWCCRFWANRTSVPLTASPSRVVAVTSRPGCAINDSRASSSSSPSSSYSYSYSYSYKNLKPEPTWLAYIEQTKQTYIRSSLRCTQGYLHNR